MVSILELCRPVRPAKRTRSLPPVHIVRERQEWLYIFLVFGIVAISGVLGVFIGVISAEREKAEMVRVAKAKTDQEEREAERRIKVTYQDGGLVCLVPPEREDVAPAVHGACQALANQLQRIKQAAK
jgi:hypothetical protein